LVTARIDQNAKLAALDLGADDFLVKPFNSVEVETRIRNLLTSARLEQQLIQSEKLNALGRMAAGLLHEINNPLNYMLTALEVLKRNTALNQDEDVEDTLADIRDGAKQIESITTDLRAFAYPDTATGSRECNLLKAVQQALRFTAGELKDVEVDARQVGDIVVPASEPRVIQVLVNLLSNASYAMRNVADKKLTVRVDTADEVVISITDSGEGIPDDVKEKLFDPFFTTRDVGEGVGLGLSVCHTIISRFNGTIEFDSRPGRTTFYVRLPAFKEGEEDAHGSEAHETGHIAG
jgi:C4-dicarboxylate-specific signal transduction histidine kinase